MNRVKVSLKDRSYNILVGRGLIGQAGVIIKKLGIGKDAVVITNKSVFAIYGKQLKSSLLKSGISVKFEFVPAGEQAKSSAVLIRLLGKISVYDKNKTIFIVALGGGVIGDLAGFAASIYKRGIPYVQVPTTLLAQVDSAIGGKAAIDLPIAKNLAGSFYQPKVVLSDTNVLRSLGARQIKNGLSECIKYGAIKDGRLFKYLENNYKKVLKLDEKSLAHVILSSSSIKAKVVEEDEFDRTGARAVLNYGHTIGHAIEAASGYSGRYEHGEAVAIGMVIAARISSALGLTSPAVAGRIESLVKKCGLPASIKGLKLPAIRQALLRDKKFIRGKNRFILPTGIGAVRIVEGISNSIIENTIKEYTE